jgi:hypothetical protein
MIAWVLYQTLRDQLCALLVFLKYILQYRHVVIIPVLTLLEFACLFVLRK